MALSYLVHGADQVSEYGNKKIHFQPRGEATTSTTTHSTSIYSHYNLPYCHYQVVFASMQIANYKAESQRFTNDPFL